MARTSSRRSSLSPGAMSPNRRGPTHPDRRRRPVDGFCCHASRTAGGAAGRDASTVRDMVMPERAHVWRVDLVTSTLAEATWDGLLQAVRPAPAAQPREAVESSAVSQMALVGRSNPPLVKRQDELTPDAPSHHSVKECVDSLPRDAVSGRVCTSLPRASLYALTPRGTRI